MIDQKAWHIKLQLYLYDATYRWWIWHF